MKKEENKIKEMKRDENKTKEIKKDATKINVTKKSKDEVIEIDIKTIKEKIQENKKIPNEDMQELKRKIFNVFFAIGIIMFVCIFILMGYTKIHLESYLIDLKVFSLIAIVITILIFEYAYKKDSGSLAIVGIESLVFAIFILSLYHILQYNIYPYKSYLLSIMSVFVVYYVLKIVIVLIKNLHKLKKNTNDIKKIIKKS